MFTRVEKKIILNAVESTIMMLEGTKDQVEQRDLVTLTNVYKKLRSETDDTSRYSRINIDHNGLS